MPHCTDHTCADTATDVVRVLLAVAEHFTQILPTEVLDAEMLLVIISAKAYDACGRSVGRWSVELSRAAQAAAPQMAVGITRGEYALGLRREFASAGHEWTDDDNRPVIPRIPPPRREQPGAPRQNDAAR